MLQAVGRLAIWMWPLLWLGVGWGPDLRAQGVTRLYTPDETIFANPERGLYRHMEVQAEGSPLSVADLRRLRNDQGISLILRLYYLKSFRDKPLSARQLNLMQTDFDRMREAGVKAVLRFAYSQSQTQPDAPLSVIEGHIEQMAPLLAANSDVIAVVQAGFIGAWGEWYYSTNGLNNTVARRAVTRKLLEAFPTGRMVQVRTPDYKRLIFERLAPLAPEEAFDGSEVARTGHHNDCFLASDTDYGTYQNIAADKAFLEADSRYTPVGGETCVVNVPRSDCDTALSELARFHWSYLNRDYNQQVLSRWVTGGCWDEVRARLGYRFELIEGEFGDHVKPGNTLSVSLRLTNTGFAAPFNGRRVELLLRERSGGARYGVALPEDPRRWMPGDTTAIDAQVGLPSDIPHGEYDLLLVLPPPERSLRERPEYAIRFANQDLWEEETGTHDLQVVVAVDDQAGGEPHTGDLQFAPYEVFTGRKSETPARGSAGVEVYPNPFRDRTRISVSVDASQVVEMELYDTLGRRVRRLHRGLVQTGEAVSVSVEALGLPSGSYLLDVRGRTFHTARHLFVVR